MSTTTENLGLFKYDPIVDKDQKFDIDQALNQNWDKVDAEVQNLKSSVSEGKSLIAAAVTDKGVNTAADASFATMAGNIDAIELGVILPELTNPAGAGDIAASHEALDGDGVKVTGTLPEVVSDTTETLTNAGPSHASGNIRMTGTMGADKIMRAGSKIMTSIAASYFGDATAADVVSGKTFTSAAGLNVSGSAGVPGVYVTGTKIANTPLVLNTGLSQIKRVIGIMQYSNQTTAFMNTTRYMNGNSYNVSSWLTISGGSITLAANSVEAGTVVYAIAI